jgi:hypothetical protein
LVAGPINIDDLWNADAYRLAGDCPWTIFAYPASLADAQRLPRDEDAKRFLAELHGRGLRVGIWVHPGTADTIYFACPYEERERVHNAIEELERQGTFPRVLPAGIPNTCSRWLLRAPNQSPRLGAPRKRTLRVAPVEIAAIQLRVGPCSVEPVKNHRASIRQQSLRIDPGRDRSL